MKLSNSIFSNKKDSKGKGMGISAIMLLISGLLFAAVFIPATTVGSLGAVLGDAFDDAHDLTDTTIVIEERRNMSDLARFVYDRAKPEGCAEDKGVNATLQDGGYPGLSGSHLTSEPSCFGADASTARQYDSGGVIGVLNRNEEGQDMEGVFSREEFRVEEDVKIGPNQGDLWMDKRIIAGSSQTRTEQIMIPCTQSGLMDILREIYGKAGAIISHIPGLGSADDALRYAYNHVPDSVTGVLEDGYSDFKEEVGSPSDVINEMGSTSTSYTSDLYDAYYDYWIDDDDGLISGVVDSIKDAIDDLPVAGAVIDAIEDGYNTVSGIVVDVGSWFKDKYNDALDLAKQHIMGKDFFELFTDLVNRHVGTGDHYVVFFNNHDVSDDDRVYNWIDETDGFADRIYCEFYDTNRFSIDETHEGVIQSMLAEEQNLDQQYLQLCEGDTGYIQMNREEPFNDGEAGRSITGASRSFPFIVMTNTGDCS